jgi:hypothetical protein
MTSKKQGQWKIRAEIGMHQSTFTQKSDKPV